VVVAADQHKQVQGKPRCGDQPGECGLRQAQPKQVTQKDLPVGNSV
jgi:hypothetical protein